MTTKPKLDDDATVEQCACGYLVMVGDTVIAGPFPSEASAWRWIDRNEVYETWQRPCGQRA